MFDTHSTANRLAPESLPEIFAARDEFLIYADSAVIFSALAVESSLNYFGVVHLGEKFYQSHYERLGLVQKLSALLATCSSLLVEKDDDVIKAFSELSRLRNNLAHPKAKEITALHQIRSYHTRIDSANESVAAMDKCLELFVVLEPRAAWIVSMA